MLERIFLYVEDNDQIREIWLPAHGWVAPKPWIWVFPSREIPRACSILVRGQEPCSCGERL